MSKKYIGITIGPIVDTMLDVSSPAATWFASFLFSDITRRLCKKILEEEEFKDTEIYSPYYSEEVDIYADGVGKYHDRILFSIEVETTKVEDCMHKIIFQVKKDTAEYMKGIPNYDQESCEEFLEEYLQIHYIIEDEIKKNIIVDLSNRLSALELMKTFPEDNSKNPILRLMLGYEKGKNELIKNGSLYSNVKNKAQLEQNGTIRTIEMIAQSKVASELKRYKYFAVVNADGDHMGETIKNMGNKELVAFSHKLFQHASNAAEAIKNYGGMTIYAGGDDILFLAPVVGKQGKTIFALCDEICKSFEELMKEDTKATPSLSFGIAIQYYKYPLYEALEQSRDQLSVAKTTKDRIGEKNATVVELQKHSGQSLNVRVFNENMEKLDQFIRIGQEDDASERTLHSIIYSLENFKALYVELIRNAKRFDVEKFTTVWCHMFDNDSQKMHLDYIAKVVQCLYEECIIAERPMIHLKDYAENKNDVVDENKKSIEELQILAFSKILRLKKFFQEKGDDE